MSEMKHPGLAETVGRWAEAQQHLAWKVVQTHERSIALLSAEIMRREHPRCERLTDEEHRDLWLGESGIDGQRTALRIIDAQAAERDALVAQLEAARGQLKAIGDAYDDMPDFAHPDQWRDFGERVAELAAARADAAEAQVAELTRDLGEAREERNFFDRERQNAVESLLATESEVARLTEALAAAEAENMRLRNDPMSQRAYAAEARVRELTDALAAEARASSELFERDSASIRELEAQHDRDTDDLARAVRNEDSALARVRESEEANACVADYQDALVKAEALATEWKQTAESYRFGLQALRTEHEKTLARFTRG